MKLKALIVVGIGLMLAGINDLNAQVKVAPPVSGAAPKQHIAPTLQNNSKAQIESLLHSLENGQIPNSDLAGAAHKVKSYINEDITAAEKTLDKANSQDAKKLESKKSLQQKAEVLAGKYSSGKETKKETLIELLKQYSKTL